MNADITDSELQLVFKLAPKRYYEYEDRIFTNLDLTRTYMEALYSLQDGHMSARISSPLDPTYHIFYYCRFVLRDRWPVAEQMILTNPMHCCLYACYVMHSRWYEAEPYILACPQASYYYAYDVIKDRWPEAEAIIRTHNGYNALYHKNLKVKYR